MSDLISRQAAIDVCNSAIDLWHGQLGEGALVAVKEGIEGLPSAKPERKKEKWRRRLVDSGFNADWHCSECGWKTSLEEHGYNFCPNCGADMRGEQE